MSITLDLEVKRGWSGILIEPNQKKLEQLKSKKRKSWIVPACVSSAPYPDEVAHKFKEAEFIFLILCYF